MVDTELATLRFKDRKTGELFVGVESVREYLEDDLLRLMNFNRAISYYKTHGWYGGLNADLFEIDFIAL